MLDRFTAEPEDNVRTERGVFPHYQLLEACEFEAMFGVWFLCYLETHCLVDYMTDMRNALENDGRIILMEPVLPPSEYSTRL